MAGRGKKLFYDRLPQVENDPNKGLQIRQEQSSENALIRKRDSITNRERPITAISNPPDPRLEYISPAYGGSVVAGDKEASVDVESSGPPDAGVDSTIPNTTKGFTDDAGNHISVQPDGSLLLSHTTGAYVAIKPDGAIYVTAMGDKGINLVSGKGGIGIHSQGQIVFDSEDSIIMSAKGAIGLHTAGAFPITLDSGGSILQRAGQSMKTEIGATDTKFVGGSQSTMVVGNGDYQVQGNFKIGSATELNMDAAKTHLGARDLMSINSEGPAAFTTKASMLLTSQGNFQAVSKGSMGILSESQLVATGNKGVTLESPQQMTMRGDIVNVESKSGMMLDSSEYLFARAKTLAASAATTLAIKAGTSLKLSSMGTLDIDADGAINIAGATIDLNSRAKDPTEPDDPMTSTPRSAPPPATIDQLLPDDKLSSDNFTSKEAFQAMNKDYEAKKNGFPYTDFTMSGDDYAALKNNGGQLPSGADTNADEKATSGGSAVIDGPDYGTRYPSGSSYGGGGGGGGGGGDYDPGDYVNTSVAREPDMAPPTSSNPVDTVGMYALRGIPGRESIPGDGQVGVDAATIRQNLLHLQENIRLPLLKEHPDMRTARGFILKYDDNTSNPHYKGLALDFVTANKRDLSRLVEVADWASKKLPCKLVRIEKANTYSYLHIEAAEVGQTGQSCQLETCSDAEGKNCTPGLKVGTYQYKDAEVSKRIQKGYRKGFD